ncbi:hypothetical protein ARMGADRAFT_1088402 [Armillaria gallica]|uniref:Uncharacterized protein n=1 Tax=Armillaria gallica TaxID=47427 RepID=A0A2H3CSF9_ARMGA|nr:hypothetical protein ARMGADRAFT_1088402 [Armillaria gallica]
MTLNTLYELHLEFSVKRGALRYRVKREWPLITSITAPRRIDTSRFLAVIISSDAYKFPPLHGCVLDALLMEKCLTKDLGVPKGRIRHLTDTWAHIYPNHPSIHSRVSIIRASLAPPSPTYFDGQRKPHPLIFEEQRQG